MVRPAVLLGGLVGSLLLLVAEFTPLLTVHSSASSVALKTVQTGSHQSYALVPVALLAIFLSFAVWRSASRLALVAIAVLGLVALLIALVGDLPDAQETGFLSNNATSLVGAHSTPSIGLYLETLGAVVLLITAGAGLLLLAAPSRSHAREGRPTAGPPSPGEAA